MDRINTRRIKQIRLSERLLVDILNGLADRQCFYFPKVKGLPEGTQVLRVTHCWDRRCLLAMVTHESFPEVPDGELPPLDDELWFDAVDRKDLAQTCAEKELAEKQAEIDRLRAELDELHSRMQDARADHFDD